MCIYMCKYVIYGSFGIYDVCVICIGALSYLDHIWCMCVYVGEWNRSPFCNVFFRILQEWEVILEPYYDETHYMLENEITDILKC